MNKIASAALTAAIALGAAGMASADGKHSMKGWELYTWFDLSCSASPQLHSTPNADSWCAALVVGTNRLKSPAEIRRAPMKWRDLAPAIDALRAGEDVAWITMPGDFALPPDGPRQAIVARAKLRKLTLGFSERK
jgi:hypothetical protein